MGENIVEREVLPREDWQWLADQLRAWPVKRVHPDRTMCEAVLRPMAADVIEAALEALAQPVVGLEKLREALEQIDMPWYDTDDAIDQIRAIARTALAASPSPVVPESAWLVEQPKGYDGRTRWLCGPKTPNPRLWTVDANKAIRFCRQQDANEICLMLNDGGAQVNCIATEHQWIGDGR